MNQSVNPSNFSSHLNIPNNSNGQKPEQVGAYHDPINQSVLLDYFKIIRRRKWLILLCIIGVFIPVALWTYNMTPVYEASATILYDEPHDTMFALDIGQSYNKSAIVNATVQLKSRTLANEVAQSLPQNVINLFEFPDPLPPGVSRQQILTGILQENLGVNGVRGSDILEITIQAPDPNAAKVIANTYVECMIESNLRINREEISNIHEFVENQVTVFQDKLSIAEEALQVFKEKNNMLSLSDASTEALSRMTEAEIAYNQAKTERQALEQRKRYIEKKKQELAPSLTVASSPIAQQLKQQLLNLEMQHSALELEGSSQNSPGLLSLKQQISDVKQNLVNELLTNAIRENLVDPLSQIRNLLQESITLDVDLETYKARENGLKKIMDEYNADLQTLPGQELELARLIREKEVNDKIYSMLLEKREESRITKAGKIGDIRVIDLAEAPIEPVEPQKKKNLAMGLILGFSLGVGLAFFLESLDTTIKSQEEVESILKLPVLASIPNINQNGALFFGKRDRHTKENYSKKLLSHFTNIPHLYEAHQNFLLNFSFINISHNLKSLLVTSAGAGEGKTLNAINIAQLFARTGKKTLLIDCDLRRPMVHKILEIHQAPGLTHVLINKISIEKATQQLDHGNLSVLTCGALPPNPSDILNTEKMQTLLAVLRKFYDYIIIDAPPIIAVTDSIVLGAKVDGVCLVVRSAKTSREAALRASKILEKSGIKIAGVILNDVDLKSVYGYYKDYYYYSTKKKKQTV